MLSSSRFGRTTEELMSELDSRQVEADVACLERFGRRLQEAREYAGMSQEAVTQKLGFPTRSLTRWENGKADAGSYKLVRLADLYGVSMDWIAGRTEVRHCIKSGAVMIDSAALRELQGLADCGAGLRDVPKHLLRPPGVNCASVVPNDVDVISPEAAESVRMGMQQLWKRLGGNKL